MNILTIAMFAVLVVLSLNPETKKKDNYLALDTKEISKEIADRGIETVLEQATNRLKEKHLQ